MGDYRVDCKYCGAWVNAHTDDDSTYLEQYEEQVCRRCFPEYPHKDNRWRETDRRKNGVDRRK